jgi:fibronectin type III domain protein
MSRPLVFAVLALALSLVLASAAPAKRPPPPPDGGGGAGAPTNLRITSSTDTSISLAWDVAKSGSSSWWYCVVRNGEGCLRVDPPATTLSLSRLWPGRTTTYTVVTFDLNGHRSAPSNSVTHTTPPDTTPPSPAPVVTVQAVYPTRIVVSWTQAVDALTQTTHTLFVDGAPVFNAYAPWTELYLEPSSTHTFKVTAHDYFGNTVESEVVTATTPPKTDNVAPTAPTNLQFSFQTASPELWLTWSPSTDNTDSQGLILYETYLNGVLVPDGNIGGTNTIAYCRDIGPTTVVLRAVDTSGNRSGPSNTLNFDC